MPQASYQRFLAVGIVIGIGKIIANLNNTLFIRMMAEIGVSSNKGLWVNSWYNEYLVVAVLVYSVFAANIPVMHIFIHMQSEKYTFCFG